VSSPPPGLDSAAQAKHIVSSSGEAGDEIAAYIDGYEPSRVVRTWVLIAAFVRHVVLTIAPESQGAASRYLSLLARYIDWCVLTEGAVPDERLLTDSRVRAFLKEWGRSRSISWVSQSQLRFDELLARYYNRVDLTATKRGAHAPRLYPPYNAEEVARILSWARSRPLERTRQNALGIALLGLGFGLRGTDMAIVTRSHLTDHGADGIELELPDRTIWCDTLVEDDVRAFVAHLEPEGAAIGYPTAGAIGSFLTGHRRINRGRNLIPSINQMRTTWFSRRASHIPALTAIMRSYGVTHISSLHPLIPFLPTTKPADARDIGRTVNVPERTS